MLMQPHNQKLPNWLLMGESLWLTPFGKAEPPKGFSCKDQDITNWYNMAIADCKEAQERMKDAKKLLKAIVNEEDDATEKDPMVEIAGL